VAGEWPEGFRLDSKARFDDEMRRLGCRIAGKVGELSAGNLDRTGPRTLVRQSRLCGHDLRFGVGVHETTFRVNVRWVTPLGEETASTS
jgi:hypothetical protein